MTTEEALVADKQPSRALPKVPYFLAGGNPNWKPYTPLPTLQWGRDDKPAAKYLFQGETLTIVEIAGRVGVHPHALYKRLAKGMTIEVATNNPPRSWVRRTEGPVR